MVELWDMRVHKRGGERTRLKIGVKYEGRGREGKINRTERRMTANNSTSSLQRSQHEQESMSSVLAALTSFKTGQIHLNTCWFIYCKPFLSEIIKCTPELILILIRWLSSYHFLADGPDKENMPIGGAVPVIQNKDHSRQGDSSKGRETYNNKIIIIFKQGAFWVTKVVSEQPCFLSLIIMIIIVMILIIITTTTWYLRVVSKM